MEIVAFVQPQCVGQAQVGAAVGGIMGIPHIASLLAQLFDGVRPQKIQNLLLGVAVGGLGQHGQCHVNIQRRIHRIFLIGKQKTNAVRKERGQAVGVAIGLIVLVPLAVAPGFVGCIIGLIIVKIRLVGNND